MKNKKYIILLLIIVIYLVLALMFYLFHKETTESKYFYIIPTKEQNIIWKYDLEGWKDVADFEILENKFETYKNGSYVDKYSLVFNNRWYFYDKNTEPVELSNDVYMIYSSINYDSISYTLDRRINMNSKLISVFENMNININEYDYEINSYSLNDDKNTNFYTINLYKLQDEYEETDAGYSFIYSTLNSKIIAVSENECTLNFAGAFSIEGDTKYIVSCDYFDMIPSDYYLYEFSKKEFNLVMMKKGGV